jgi:Flp pilus assembly protein TadD
LTISNLGIALVQAGRLAEAIQQFKHAVQLSPSAYTHNNLGAAMMKTGRLPEAISEFQAAIRLDSDFVQAYANLAQVLKLSNRWQDAIVTAEKGIKIARSTGDNALIGQLEKWLAQLQAELRGKNDAPSAPQSSQPEPKP